MRVLIVPSTEIFSLKHMLEEADIPFTYTDDMFGCGTTAFQIVIDLENGETIDAICNSASYGHAEGLLEIMGGLTAEEGEHDSVLGWLTAEEVFKRFKYCYENHTTVYKEE